ncbi:arginase family protein, partial [Akkermansiaceae bacterium]|nr:arginase family protein [Akkermansiaceae bacterium]
MKLIPANAAPFIGSNGNKIEHGKVAIIGVAYDGTTSFRPGTRRGPDGFRSVSEAGIESYSPTQDRD